MDSDSLTDAGGIFTRMARQDLELLIDAAVPNGGVQLEEYPFEQSDVPHYHLLVDRDIHIRHDDVEAVRAVLKNTFDAANAQQGSLVIEIAYW